MDTRFTRRLSLIFILILALLGSAIYLYQVFNVEPLKPKSQIKPDVEIHYGGPPIQEGEK